MLESLHELWSTLSLLVLSLSLLLDLYCFYSLPGYGLLILVSLTESFISLTLLMSSLSSLIISSLGPNIDISLACLHLFRSTVTFSSCYWLRSWYFAYYVLTSLIAYVTGTPTALLWMWIDHTTQTYCYANYSVYHWCLLLEIEYLLMLMLISSSHF